jgi:hypothetical protein
MQIPPNLSDFDFLCAWEDLRAHRKALGYPVEAEKDLLAYFSSIGSQTAVVRIHSQIEWEKQLALKHASELP